MVAERVHGPAAERAERIRALDAQAEAALKADPEEQRVHCPVGVRRRSSKPGPSTMRGLKSQVRAETTVCSRMPLDVVVSLGINQPREVLLTRSPCFKVQGCIREDAGLERAPGLGKLEAAVGISGAESGVHRLCKGDH